MMWQKARVVRTEKHPEALGQELWVRVGKPIVKTSYDMDTKQHNPPESLFDVSVTDEYGRLTCVPPRLLELLPEFADDVPLISWEKFLKRDQTNEQG